MLNRVCASWTVTHTPRCSKLDDNQIGNHPEMAHIADIDRVSDVESCRANQQVGKRNGFPLRRASASILAAT